MTNQPQIPVEEIDLLPHPLDAWRAALNALIAVAPGASVDIAWHLNDARERTLTCRDFSAATQGEAMLIDRLMLLGAGKLFGQKLDAAKQAPHRNALGCREACEISHRLLAHVVRHPVAHQPASDAPPASQPLAGSSPAYPDQQLAPSGQARNPAQDDEPAPHKPSASLQQEQEGQQ